MRMRWKAKQVCWIHRFVYTTVVSMSSKMSWEQTNIGSFLPEKWEPPAERQQNMNCYLITLSCLTLFVTVNVKKSHIFLKGWSRLPVPDKEKCTGRDIVHFCYWSPDYAFLTVKILMQKLVISYQSYSESVSTNVSLSYFEITPDGDTRKSQNWKVF